MATEEKLPSPQPPPPAIPSVEPMPSDDTLVSPVDFLVVGVGASAGGLEAFRELLENLPPNPGLTFLFVQHLDPSQPSLLVSLLSKATCLTVCEAEHGTPLEEDHVYILPPNALMGVHRAAIELQPRGARRAPNMPADFLFRSLA